MKRRADRKHQGAPGAFFLRQRSTAPNCGRVARNHHLARRIEVNGLVAAVFVLGFVQGAYHTEVLRAAIQAVPVGQSEAAKAYGMSPLKRFRRITLPAMLPNAIPGLANLWLNVTKDTALISVVGFTELALATRQAASVSKQYLLLYLVAQAIYLLISLSSTVLFTWLERYVRRGQPKLA